VSGGVHLYGLGRATDLASRQGLPGVKGPRGLKGGWDVIDAMKKCKELGGKIYLGICLKSQRLDANADTIPFKCAAYQVGKSMRMVDAPQRNVCIALATRVQVERFLVVSSACGLTSVRGDGCSRVWIGTLTTSTRLQSCSRPTRIGGRTSNRPGTRAGDVPIALLSWPLHTG